jgi:hypothetical protein
MLAPKVSEQGLAILAKSGTSLTTDGRRAGMRCRESGQANPCSPSLCIKAAPPRTFTNSDNMVEMIRRGNGFRDLASKQAVELAIMAGRGNVDLLLTPEQYARLVG